MIKVHFFASRNNRQRFGEFFVNFSNLAKGHQIRNPLLYRSARVYTNNIDLMIDIGKDRQWEITNQPETV